MQKIKLEHPKELIVWWEVLQDKGVGEDRGHELQFRILDILKDRFQFVNITEYFKSV